MIGRLAHHRWWAWLDTAQRRKLVSNYKHSVYITLRIINNERVLLVKKNDEDMIVVSTILAELVNEANIDLLKMTNELI